VKVSDRPCVNLVGPVVGAVWLNPRGRFLLRGISRDFKGKDSVLMIHKRTQY